MHQMQRPVSCDNSPLRFETHRDRDRHYRYDHSGGSFWFCASILNVRKPYRCLPHNNEIIACSLCREEYPDTAEGAIQSFDHFCTERRLGECVQAFSSYALFYNHIRYFHHAEDGIWAPLWRNARMRGNGNKPECIQQ